MAQPPALLRCPVLGAPPSYCAPPPPRARTWLVQHLRFDQPTTVSFFESVIRVVGGLVSAAQLSGDAALGVLGADLAERLLPAFTWAPTGALGC